VVGRPVERASGVGGGDLRGARERLVETLREKGIRDLSVLRAIEMTPRHAFIPTGLRHRAYEDAPLPIGNGQTISQPWVHARYLEVLALTGKERVLEVGTGSGYQTVLLAHLAAQVFSIERIPALFNMAREAIQRSGVRNVNLLLGDGSVGWREYSPYDAILVGAGAPAIPQPLVEQLAEGGRLLIPIGDRDEQKLMLVQRKSGETQQTEIAAVRFVPLLGSHGWGVGEGQ
jgi:protein-L-isoaspartate(D-aspartate) O-methyltransferase